MKEPNAKEILNRYLEGKCTEEEAALLESWHLSYPLDAVEDIDFDEQTKDLDKVWAALQEQEPVVKRARLWPKLAAAAAVTLVAGIGVFFYLQKIKAEKEQIRLASGLLPGKDDAVLTLSNGQKIILNEASNGQVAQQSGITITKAADGTIIYNSNVATGKSQGGKMEYNTIATPRGGKYQLNLPDGTKVWLNAASSLKFPVNFAANERRVELNGEAYFEVSKNRQRPFHVKTTGQDLEVLGTHFNINSFKDEVETRTTLLEGAVKILPYNYHSNLANPVEAILKPGQQAVLGSQGLNIVKADVGEVMSWKNGMFQFNDTELSSIMRQASRWYDVDVVYEGKIPAIRFSGEVSRRVNAAAFLDMLKYLDVKFSIESLGGNKRRIVVSR
jgi:transmembrane sensor